MEVLVRILPVVFVLQFAWSYYRTCWCRGYKLDLWHFNQAQMLGIMVLMQPFSRSPLNVIALGPAATQKMQFFVTPAALITDLGYFFILVGGNLWRVRLGIGLRKTVSGMMNSVVRPPLMIIHSRRLLLLMTGVALVLMVGAIAFYFHVAGFGFDMRGLAITIPAFRPIEQFSAFLGIAVGSSLLQRYAVHRERIMLVLFVILTAALLFYGSRTFALGILVNVALIYLVLLRKRLRLSLVALAIFAAIAVSTLLNALRSGSASFVSSFARFGADTLYGNSYSDLRDFAVILSDWNGTYYHGLTYAAGLLSFVPRFLFPFRDQYAIGVVTARLAGFSPLEHPGLRVGTFGEAFLNFGLAGVVLLGIILGAGTRLVDMRVKQELRMHNRLTLLAYCYPVMMLLPAFATTSVIGASLYSILLFFAMGWLLIWVSRFIGLPLG